MFHAVTVSPRCQPLPRRPAVVLALVAGLAGLQIACGRAGTTTEAEVSPLCSEIPGCDAARTPVEGPTETIWRVEVTRTAQGAVRLARIESVVVAEGTGVPPGYASGDYVLAAVDASGAPVDGQYLRFPDAVRLEREDAFAPLEYVPLEGRDVSVVGYLRALPAAGRVSVFDDQGREVVTAPLRNSQAAAGPAPSARPVSVFGWFSPTAVLSAQGAGSASHCGHVRLIEGEPDRASAAGMAYREEGVELVVPGPTQRAVVRGALQLMEPLLCSAVSRVAFGSIPSQSSTFGAVDRFAAGDLIVINTTNVETSYSEESLASDPRARLTLMRTLIHEAGHAVDNLLVATGRQAGPVQGQWSPAARAEAVRTLDHVRMRRNLRHEWERVHASFVAEDWARRYAGSPDAMKAFQGLTAQEVARSGGMSRYGATNPADDIAEMVAWMYMGRHYRAAGIPNGPKQTEDFACQAFQSHGSTSLPADYAAAYTKVMFLKDLGVVRTDDVQACVGRVTLPLTAPGFHFWEGSELKTTYSDDRQARIGTTRNRFVYVMSAKGSASYRDRTHPSTIRLELDLAPATTPVAEVPWPRGVYPLGVSTPHSVRLSLEGAAAGSFTVIRGFVLVAEASNARIAGSAFVRVGFRPMAPMPVPQTFDPPLVIRFLMER